MLSRRVVDFLNEINILWKKKKGKQLSDYFSLRHAHFYDEGFHIHLDEYDKDLVEPPLNELIGSHFSAITCIMNRDYFAAHEHQYIVTQGFIKIFQNQKNQNWLLPVIYTVCIDIRLLTAKMERFHSSQNDPTFVLNTKEIWEKTADVIMSAFRICAADNRSSLHETKKWGMMQLVNQLFKIYFRNTKLHLMKPLDKAIQSTPLKNEFSKLQQVTYRYHIGCKAAYDGEYKKAEENLMYAFNNCPVTSAKNRRLILLFLIPVKIASGYMPVSDLVRKYDLEPLGEIADAIKKGKVKNIDVTMKAHRNFFMNSGIYLIVEKLKLLAYRNLFKKVHLLHKNNPILDMAVLAAARKMDDENFTLDEVECVLSNLIYQGKIKGYISSTHQKLVLSKLDPFPKLSTLTNV